MSSKASSGINHCVFSILTNNSFFGVDIDYCVMIRKFRFVLRFVFLVVDSFASFGDFLQCVLLSHGLVRVTVVVHKELLTVRKTVFNVIHSDDATCYPQSYQQLFRLYRVELRGKSLDVLATPAFLATNNC